jgi:hypothetical protein
MLAEKKNRREAANPLSDGGGVRLSPDTQQYNTSRAAKQGAPLKALAKRALPWWSRILGRRLAQRLYDALKLRTA